MAPIRQGVMVIAGKPACFGDTQHIAVGLHFQGKKVLKLLSAFGGIQICPFSQGQRFGLAAFVPARRVIPGRCREFFRLVLP